MNREILICLYLVDTRTTVARHNRYQTFHVPSFLRSKKVEMASSTAPSKHETPEKMTRPVKSSPPCRVTMLPMIGKPVNVLQQRERYISVSARARV